MQPSTTKLALDIVESHFGPVCHAVADSLVALGACSLQELCRHASTQPAFVKKAGAVSAKVRAALLVLLAHDLVAVSMSMKAYLSQEQISAAGRSGRGGRGGRGGRKKSNSRAAQALQNMAVRILSTALPAKSETEVEGAEYGGLRYELRPATVLRRLRFPRYLEAVRRAAGPDAVECAKVLLQHGPWTHAAVVKEAANAISGPVKAGVKRKRAVVDDDDEAEEAGAAAAGAAASGAGASDVDPAARQRAVKAWRALEDAGLITRAIGLSVGFPALMLAGSLPGGTQLAPDAYGHGHGPSGTSSRQAGKKKGRVVDDDDDAGSTAGLWRFSWEIADRVLRNQMIVRYATEGPGAKLVPGAGQVVAAAMHVVGVKSERGLRVPLSGGVSVKDITRTVRATGFSSAASGGAGGAGAGSSGSGAAAGVHNEYLSPEDDGEDADGEQAGAGSSERRASRAAPWDVGAATDTTVDAVCQRLNELPHRLLARLQSYGQDKVYGVQYSQAVLAIQLRALHTIIEARYQGLQSSSGATTGGVGLAQYGSAQAKDGGNNSGPEIIRVLRLLLEKGALDEKAVSDLAMLEPKTARSILFKLHADGIVVMREVPKRPDRAPQHTVFVFHAMWDKIMPLVSDWCCAALLRLRIRLRQEQARIAACEASGELAPGPTRTEWDDGAGIPPLPSQAAAAAGPSGPSTSGSGATVAFAGLSSPSSSSGKSSPGLERDSEGRRHIDRARAGVRKMQVSALRLEESLFLFSEL